MISHFVPGVMSLLRPLLLDVVPTIQQTAALALGRLANYNEDLAEAVVKGDILPQLVYSLAEQNVSFPRALNYLPVICWNPLAKTPVLKNNLQALHHLVPPTSIQITQHCITQYDIWGSD